MQDRPGKCGGQRLTAGKTATTPLWPDGRALEASPESVTWRHTHGGWHLSPQPYDTNKEVAVRNWDEGREPDMDTVPIERLIEYLQVHLVGGQMLSLQCDDVVVEAFGRRFLTTALDAQKAIDATAYLLDHLLTDD